MYSLENIEHLEKYFFLHSFSCQQYAMQVQKRKTNCCLFFTIKKIAVTLLAKESQLFAAHILNIASFQPPVRSWIDSASIPLFLPHFLTHNFDRINFINFCFHFIFYWCSLSVTINYNREKLAMVQFINSTVCPQQQSFIHIN